MDTDKKNLIIAFVLIGIIFVAWDLFYIRPAQKAEQAAQQPAQNNQADSAIGITEQPLPDDQPRIPDSPKPQASDGRPKERATLESPLLWAGLTLEGARLDRARLKNYHTTPEGESPLVDVLNSTENPNPYYVSFGWIGEENAPDFSTVWSNDTARSNDSNTVLTWTNEDNVVFEQVWSLGDDYMFDVELNVTNNSSSTIDLAPYGLIARAGTPETSGIYILHEGYIAVIDDALVEVDYEEIRDDGNQTFSASWLGLTDKFWLVALAPGSQDKNTAHFVSAPHRKTADTLYQSDFVLERQTISPGQTTSTKQQLFVGAKEVPVLEKYREAGLPLFDRAVDFGWYYFLTKPIFTVLNWIAKGVENFGIAIIILTILVRLLLFPLAQKSYTSMSKMKKLSPEISSLRERFANDRQQMSIEMMKLYKREKINPMAGCVPIILQIPIFFSLYKVLFVTIEMRHAPFFGWITDLSAPDPSGLLYLFGLIEWSIPSLLSILNIGIWPILMGLTMWLQMKMNPTPPDPLQRKIFTYMPIAFTFLLGQMPAGLVIYWTCSNVLSMLQQWVIMKRMGVKIG